MIPQTQNTSWNAVAPWYAKLVGSEGHYYHEHVVLPNVLRLLKLQADSRLLDLGCGQGILAYHLPEIQEYLGLDLAPALITEANKRIHRAFCRFQVSNVAQPFSHPEAKYTHVTFILSLQNMDKPATAIKNAAASLLPGGKIAIVLNHPCFRIPRQSGWGTDEKTKQQYRWLNRYLSPLKIPIQMNPGQKTGKLTWSFHHSLQDLTHLLFAEGLSITALEEWTSDKQSQGKAAKMENRARQEFPLFLCLVASKRS